MLSEFLNGVYAYKQTMADLNRGGNPDAKKGFYAKHKNRRTAKKKTKSKNCRALSLASLLINPRQNRLPHVVNCWTN